MQHDQSGHNRCAETIDIQVEFSQPEQVGNQKVHRDIEALDDKAVVSHALPVEGDILVRREQRGNQQESPIAQHREIRQIELRHLHTELIGRSGDDLDDHGDDNGTEPEGSDHVERGVFEVCDAAVFFLAHRQREDNGHCNQKDTCEEFQHVVLVKERRWGSGFL